MKTSVYWFCMLFLLLLSSTGCNESISILGNDESPKNEYLFTLEDALSVAGNIQLPGSEFDTKSSSVKTISEYQSIGEDSPFFHIINYEEGGFVVLSADKRLSPVLAYSDDSQFSFDEEIPGGFQIWMNNVKQEVTRVRTLNIQPDEVGIARWDAFIANNNFALETNGNTVATRALPPPTPCSTPGEFYPNYQVTTYGPLLSTSWGQGVGYNDALTNLGCTEYSNGRPPVGCVPVACGQLMKYHQKPTGSGYSWSSMTKGSSALQNFLKNLGTAFSITYNCNGSGVYDSNVLPALINTYGYSSSSYSSSYNYTNLYNFIVANKPVLISATNTVNASQRHMWVCDGLQLTYDGYCNSSNTIETSLYSKYLHMNWGAEYTAYCQENYFNYSSSYQFNSNILLFFISK